MSTSIQVISHNTMLVHSASGATVQIRALNTSGTGWSFTTITPGYERGFVTIDRITRKRAMEIGALRAARALTSTEAAGRDQRQAEYIQSLIDTDDLS